MAIPVRGAFTTLTLFSFPRPQDYCQKPLVANLFQFLPPREIKYWSIHFLTTGTPGWWFA